MTNTSQISCVAFSKSILRGVEIKRCSKTPQCYKHHMHKELSIGLIQKGSTVVNINNTDICFSADEGILIPPYKSHMCSPYDIDNWQFIMLYIDSDYYSKYTDFKDFIKLSGPILLKLKNLMEIMQIEKDISYTESVLVEFLLDIKAANNIEDNKIKPNKDTSIASIIKEYITIHYKENISLSSLEVMFSTSKFTIIRKFSSRYDTTPASYQLQLKVAEAKNMLSNGHDVFDICTEIGFYDQSHFIREFKKMNGITPHDYLKSISKIDNNAII